VAVCVAFIAIGIPLLRDTSCVDTCNTLAETVFFAGAPISAVFTVVVGGDLILAWPLEITLWVVVGFLLARFSDNRGRNVLGAVLLVVLLALVYGLVLSLQVEIAIDAAP
jgi:hypothetical protein